MRARAFAALQYLLPKRASSALVRTATRVRTRWFKDLLIRAFRGLYAVDLADAAEPDPFAYGSFNEFFTRALRPGARPIAPEPDAVASPVDGTVSECGPIEGDRLLQAKGRRYALRELLADRDWGARFERGTFLTIYLAPRDYHRIHMPCDGRLLETVFVPGRLFSVNAATARHVPRLFARNERVLTRFDGSGVGTFALVLVGAMNVASMETVWAGEIAPRRPRGPVRLPDAAVVLPKGAECGRFNMGSTVILLFEPGRVALSAAIRAGIPVRMGQPIGRVAR
ncbi:MAG: phosphatidylserine decarboxylase [Gammaproteobacteria bacterium]|nr:phosphatidylserine decarboxylase [Gammaproteobacteria bacterium]